LQSLPVKTFVPFAFKELPIELFILIQRDTLISNPLANSFPSTKELLYKVSKEPKKLK
jgi:hypothetical protein